MHYDEIGLNAWVTAHGAHRELRPVDLDRASRVASGPRQVNVTCTLNNWNAPLGQCKLSGWTCCLKAVELCFRMSLSEVT